MIIIVVDDERFILNGEVDLICRGAPETPVRVQRMLTAL